MIENVGPKSRRLRIGQKVRILTGAFEGRRGNYQGGVRRHCERVDTPLGPVELPAEHLVAE
jgi:hypothetical protein